MTIIQLPLGLNNSPKEPEFSKEIRRTEYDGEPYYSLVDIMAQFSDLESRPDILWKRTKQRLSEAGFQHDQNVIMLKLLAKDGKLRKTDCANAATCLRIVQSVPSQKAESIRVWLANLGIERLEENATPGLASQRARERDLALLKKAGYGEHEAVKRLETRLTGIETFKSITALISQICEKPSFPDFVNAEYMALFDETASGLKIILNTKSIRDALPRFQLAYLVTAEAGLEMMLKTVDRDNMPMSELIRIVDVVIRPLGEHLKLISDTMGVHHITGQKLLKE